MDAWVSWTVRGFRHSEWWLWTLLVLAGCSGLRRMGPVREDVMRARQLSQQGIDAWQRGQRREAEQVFAQAVTCCPEDVAARCRLANCLWERGATEAALAHLTEAVQLSGHSDRQLLVQLGQMHLKLGQLSEAGALADEAVRLDPQSAAAWRLRADVLERSGRLNEAMESYYRSLSYDSQDAEVLLALAEIHQQLGRPSRVLATLGQLDRQYAGDAAPQRVWVLKGMAQQQLHRYDEALESLARACQQGPASAELLGQLAQVQWQLGQQTSAQQTLRDAFVVASPEEQASLRQLMARIAELPGDYPHSVAR